MQTHIIKLRQAAIAAGVLFALSPLVALAASPSDVTLTTDTVFSVGGITLDVYGASAIVSSATVNDNSTLSVILGPGSSIAISAPGRNQISSNAGISFLVNQTCTDDASTISLLASASAATTTVTLTPSSTLCTTPSGTGDGGGGGGGGGGGNGPVVSGGGGGGGGSYTPPSPVTTITTNPDGSVMTPEQRAALIASLQAQIQSLLAQIAAMTGGGTSFTRDLTVGSTGADVTVLQVYLNTHGYVLASSGPGSPGNETATFGGLTRAALAKFQAANGITPPAGYFGPKTRAYIAAHP